MITENFDEYRILIAGGRDFRYQKFLFRTMDRLTESIDKPIVVIHGDAKGADRLGRDWAKFRNHKIETFPANWKKHGRSAGPIRNQQMLDEGKPHKVVVFPGGTGSEHMMNITENAQIPLNCPTMRNYYPNDWVIIRVNGNIPHYKVLAGWSGGYLEGSSWKLNSGIVNVFDDGDKFVFEGSSGSLYHCNKSGYGLSYNTDYVFNSFVRQHGSKIVLMNEEDWLNMDWMIE